MSLNIFDCHEDMVKSDPEYKKEYEALAFEYVVARALIEARTAAGFTQQDVSNLAQTISDLEGDEAYDIIEDWIAKSGKTKEAYEAAFSVYAGAKPNETHGLGKIGNDEAIQALVRELSSVNWRRVEIACKGGTGRTGTALALMACMSGVPPREVIAERIQRLNTPVDLSDAFTEAEATQITHDSQAGSGKRPDRQALEGDA